MFASHNNNELNMNTEREFPEILNVPLCAELLHKKENTIYKYVSSDSIPFHKRGNSVYFLKSEIIKWIVDGE